MPLPVGRSSLLFDNSLKYEALGIDSQMMKAHEEGCTRGSNFSPVVGKLRDPYFNGLSPIVYPFGPKSVPLWIRACLLSGLSPLSPFGGYTGLKSNHRPLRAGAMAGAAFIAVRYFRLDILWVFLG